MLNVADEPLTADMIKEFHKILKTGTSNERKDWFNVGDYKKLENEVAGQETTKPEEVENAMYALLHQYNSLCKVTFEEKVIW